MYIYSGYENGRIIIDNWTSPPEFDPRERPWYKHATDIKENKVLPNVIKEVVLFPIAFLCFSLLLDSILFEHIPLKNDACS